MRRAAAYVLLVLALPAPFLGQPSDASHLAISAKIETVDGGGDAGRAPSAVLDDAGVLHVAYVRDDGRALAHAELGPAGWSTTTLMTDPEGIRQPSLALRGDDLLVAYGKVAAGGLHVARRADGAWGHETVDAGAHAGHHASLAVDREGRAHVAYFDASGGRLRYGHETALGWLLETVDDEDTVGQFASLVIDGDTVHIAYYDTSRARLKLATHVLGLWSLSVVDEERGSGWYASLALGPEGLVLGYYNWARDEPRIAREVAHDWSIAPVNARGDLGHGLDLALGDEGRATLVYKDGSVEGQVRAAVAMELPDGSLLHGTIEAMPGDFWFHDRLTVVPASGVFHVLYRRESDGFLRHAIVGPFQADFVWDPPLGAQRGVVRFTDTSASLVGEPVAWSWDFGDGSSSSGRNPTHAFLDEGLFDVTFTATSAEGLTSSITKRVPVANAPPTAAFSGPPLVTHHLPAVYDGSASSDPDGEIASYEWTVEGLLVGVGPLLTHRFETGLSTVTLTVTDDDGLADSAELVVEARATILLDVAMDKGTFTPFEPHDGRVVATALQGGPVPNLPVNVRTQWQLGQGLPQPIPTLTPPIFPTTQDIVTNDDGSAPFQVPLPLLSYYVEDAPELVTPPNQVTSFVRVGRWDVTATALGAEFVGQDAATYHVLLLSGTI